jgi:hypothetical protein
LLPALIFCYYKKLLSRKPFCKLFYKRFGKKYIVFAGYRLECPGQSEALLPPFLAWTGRASYLESKYPELKDYPWLLDIISPFI